MSKSKLVFLLLLACSVSVEGQMKNLLLNIGYEEYDGLSEQFPHLLHNNTLFFAGSDGSLGSTVWKSDGTMEGTSMIVTDDVGTTKQLALLHDNLLFSASRFGFTTLYASNGEQDNQVEIAYFFDDAELVGLTVLDTMAVFLVSYEDSTQVWRTQGSAQSTTRLGVFPESIAFVRVTTFQNYAVFSRDNNTSNEFAPIMTDGTVEGTVYVSDFLDSYGSSSSVNTAQGAGDVLFVSGSSGYILYNDSLFQSSFLDIQHTVSLDSLRIATVIFGAHYGILKFDVNALELEGPVLLNILNGTDPIVHKGNR